MAKVIIGMTGKEATEYGYPVLLTTTVYDTIIPPIDYRVSIGFAKEMRDFFTSITEFYESDFYKWGQRKIGGNCG